MVKTSSTLHYRLFILILTVASLIPDSNCQYDPRQQPKVEVYDVLGRRVREFWLHLSSVLRRLHLRRLFGWLPGVHAPISEPDRLEIDTRIARFLATELLHLFGYRRSYVDGRRMVFLRRLERPIRTS